jgi:hypothetical protein
MEMEEFTVQMERFDGSIWYVQSIGRGLCDWVPDVAKAKSFKSLQSAEKAYAKARFAACRKVFIK